MTIRIDMNSLTEEERNTAECFFQMIREKEKRLGELNASEQHDSVVKSKKSHNIFAWAMDTILDCLRFVLKTLARIVHGIKTNDDLRFLSIVALVQMSLAVQYTKYVCGHRGNRTLAQVQRFGGITLGAIGMYISSDILKHNDS
jgi:hypothetical protein